MKVIKIVHVIIGLNVGGAELMLQRLVESQLESSRLRHTVISLTSLGVIGVELKNMGVDVYFLNLGSIFNLPLVFFKLRRLLKSIKPDIVQSWMYHADFLAGLAAYSLGIRNILWGIRSTDIAKGGSRTTLLIRKLCAYLSYFIPRKILCAANVSKDFHARVGYDVSKMKVIPNGFNPNLFINLQSSARELRNQLHIPSHAVVFISVGRYSPVKDHKTFVCAALKVLEKNKNVHFILVGRGLGPDNAPLLELVSASKALSSFHFLGQRADVPICLACADVFCLHSVTEGFPNVLGEAMLAELPCIATDVGDAKYLLNSSEMTIVPSDPIALSHKMIHMLSLRSDERRKIGLLNRERVVKYFSISSISTEYFNLYIELCRA